MRSHVCALCLALSWSYGQAEPTDTLSLMQKGKELYVGGQAAEAVEVFEELVQRAADAAFTPDYRAIAMNNLALLYQSSGQTDRAERMFRRALENAQAVMIKCHVSVHAANLYLNTAQLSQAERLPLRACEESIDNDEEQRARVRSVLASISAAAGDRARAETAMVELLAFWRARPGSPLAREESAALLNNLGNLMLDVRRLEEASVYLNEAVQALEAVFGRRHTQPARARFNRACLHAFRGNHPAAAAELKQVLEIYSESLGITHPQTNRIRFAYAAALKRSGDVTQAKRVQQAAESARAEAGPTNGDYSIDYRDLMTLHNR